jgi:hypothetical protein
MAGNPLAPDKSTLGDKARSIYSIRGQSCKFQWFVLAATHDYLMGEFNGPFAASGGCRERPLLAAILQGSEVPATLRAAPLLKLLVQYAHRSRPGGSA